MPEDCRGTEQRRLQLVVGNKIANHQNPDESRNEQQEDESQVHGVEDTIRLGFGARQRCVAPEARGVELAANVGRGSDRVAP